MSDKTLLVIDMPENCDICPFCNNFDYTCEVFQIHNKKYTYEVPSDGVKPDWCPLKPIPEKMQVCGKYPQPDRIVPSYKIGWNACIDKIMEGANVQYTNVGKWIPADNPPETDETEMSDYILLSFENFPVPLVGIYELDEEGNGAYYVGDSEKSCISQGYAVNAWMPLPKPYRKE